MNGNALDASLAIDGNFNNKLTDMVCFSTYFATENWWAVDLVELTVVLYVRLTNILGR